VKRIAETVYRRGVAIIKVKQVADPIKAVNIDFLPHYRFFCLTFFLRLAKKRRA